MSHFRRKTPEELLKSIYKLHAGRLKVFIGAVSGSGKTYHMLREGRHLREQGIDVVICAVSTLQRPETVEQLGSLERVPSIRWTKDGVERKDLNLDELVKRNPEVVLVDGLAHRNRPEARFPTRLEDIRYLLGQGISVMTTVNVYELEGVAELAHKLTGLVVEETVPEEALELADEVRLIDATPQSLLQRLSEGHLQHTKTPALFQRGNLAILRELALRLMAEGVNETLAKHREEEGLIGPSGAAERILVSVQYHWNGSIHIRRGQQIAKRLNGDMVVITFVNKRRALSNDAAAFRRSIVKLVEKLEVSFEELPLRSRRLLPTDLVRHALRHNVTRLVLGHSKQTRWQELWQGSIVNDILKKTRNIDVFLVADRAEHQGERIMPAKVRDAQRQGPRDGVSTAGDVYRRLSTDEVEEKIGQLRRGTFKVYIGAAPGVGKTYTMLREGNYLLKKGIDVVIGLLEAHGRRETAEQAGDLPLIPRLQTVYSGVTLEEMDVDRILERNPEVVLVDELAHTNVPGSRRKKRYEDVVKLLEAGISVISTVNVQHLESLNDAVEQITGVRVRETVPDFMLRMADEVELIDVAPQTLQDRLRAGKVYAMEKVEQALEHFFKTGNLIALRELALREIADDVDERLESWQRRNSLRGPWRREEVIFVCVKGISANAERLVRRGFRIAYRLKARWVVAYVQDSRARLSAEQKRKLDCIQDLTTRLGGTFEVHEAGSKREAAELIQQKADAYKATQLIIGQSSGGKRWWSRLFSGSVVQPLLRSARHMDVLVVADFDPNVSVDER
ncbi:universal stress protein [Paenibacillus koleovorans]|uniref:universal stress protein n=1 Tax=Paenibacillus koleovorans TaxID=121608 RepID=UPI000FD778F5|nr:universal stress protein [Paenibacillus koleovorans]